MRPDFAVKRVYENGDNENHKVVVVDTEKATYQNEPWTSLDQFKRRKFENLVVLSEPKERIRVFYDTPWGIEYDREAAFNQYHYKYGL